MTSDFRQLREADPVGRADLDTFATNPLFGELFNDITTEPAISAVTTGRTSEEGLAPIVLGDRPEKYRRRHRALLGSIAAVVLLAVGLSVALTVGSGITGPMTTSWRAARPLPAGPSVSSPHSSSGSWQLVGDIVQAGWRLDTSGPAPGYLTCPTATACYVTGDGSTKPSGPADYDSIYFSGDGGTSWSVLALPDGLTITAPLSCASDTSCAAGGTIGGQSVFVTTSDGGNQWTVMPLSIPNELVALSCATSTNVCTGITEPSGVAAEIENDGGPPASPDNAFVQTSDGGTTWTVHPLNAGDIVSSLSCSSATNCVVTGYPASARSASVPSGFVEVTTNAGVTWTNGVLPSNFGFLNFLSALSCGDATHCMALGLTQVANPQQCGHVTPQTTPDGHKVISCSSGSTTLVSGVVTTSDGGLTWQEQALPANVPEPALSDVSCASGSLCFVSGEEAVPQQVGSGYNGGSALVLGTSDGGTTWTRSTFTVPANAPNDAGGDAYMAIGQISCPSTGFCLGLGVSDQGSTSTPVYSFLDAGGSTSDASGTTSS